ncbi:septation regulator SpoVG [Sphaerochaeta globosa]|uniref:Putative septation protein SpoVG n=1 Tax=Sphaerochaeta globosa (strain ATCC BAA-1886 / DSM 22777 / Buddy) TaxID=158189 RepID=F0RWY0_SPHGB|nr:septation regulator SpoVG [Sphaerochaeta globosa]ADY13761.1 septation protein spoVG [Sphaerochaeta globosa str. Buddy]
MDISEVRVRKVNQTGKLKAYVTVTFDSQFVVHNIKVIEGRDGDFIAMPSRQLANGEFKDVAHPISSDFRDHLQKVIMEAYASDTGETALEEELQ